MTIGFIGLGDMGRPMAQQLYQGFSAQGHGGLHFSAIIESLQGKNPA